MTNWYSISKEDLTLDPEAIRSELLESVLSSYARTINNDELFYQMLDEIETTYLHRIEPFGVSKAVPVEFFRELFADSLPPTSPVCQAVSTWQKSALFIVSIGQFTEMSIAGLQERGDLFKAAFLDAVASNLVESAIEFVQKEWMLLARKVIPMRWDLYATRYSPGYCGWDAKGLVTLFGYMADTEPPVSLLTDYRMYPMKSICGVLAVEEKINGSDLVSACRVCPEKCENIRNFK